MWALTLVVNVCVREVATHLDVLVLTTAIVLEIEARKEPSAPTPDESTSALKDLDPDVMHVAAGVAGRTVQKVVEHGVVDRDVLGAAVPAHGIAAVR